MTIALTSEVEAAIVEQAQRQGMTPERLVSESLQKLFAVPTPDETLGLAAEVYADLSEQDIEIVKEMRRTTSGGQSVHLADYGINPAQAVQLRASFATFAGEWECPEMDVYDDYDAAKTRLEASQTKAKE